MALETDKWGTILQVAQSCLMDLGEDHSRIDQFVHWALRGARDWQIDGSKSVKTKEIALNDYFAIDLPPDYISYTKVGIRKGDTIVTFTTDNHIPLIWDIVNKNKVANEDHKKILSNLDRDLDVVPLPYYGYSEPIFGLAYKDNGVGYFRENIEAKQIQFRTEFERGTRILLEYVSDGWDPQKTTLVHPTAFNLITLYVHWQNVKFKPQRALSEVAYHEAQYWAEFDRVTWRNFNLSIEDILEVMREAYVPTIQM